MTVTALCNYCVSLLTRRYARKYNSKPGFSRRILTRDMRLFVCLVLAGNLLNSSFRIEINLNKRWLWRVKAVARKVQVDQKDQAGDQAVIREQATKAGTPIRAVAVRCRSVRRQVAGVNTVTRCKWW